MQFSGGGEILLNFAFIRFVIQNTRPGPRPKAGWASWSISPETREDACRFKPMAHPVHFSNAEVGRLFGCLGTPRTNLWQLVVLRSHRTKGILKEF